MRQRHLVAVPLEPEFEVDAEAVPGALPPGRVTRRFIRRVHWRIYPLRVPKIVGCLALAVILGWFAPPTRETFHSVYRRIRGDLIHAIGQARDGRQ